MYATLPSIDWGPFNTIVPELISSVTRFFQPLIDLFERLISNPYRLAVVAFALLVTLGMLSSNISKRLIPIAAIGSVWMAWIVFNALSPSPDTPLITGPTDLNVIGAGWKSVVLMVGLGLGIIVFWTSKKNDDREKVNILVRIWCSVATPLGIWLIVTVLVDLYQIIHAYLK